MSRKSKKIPSIRIKLEGTLSPDGLRRELNEAVDDLERQGIANVKNCNLYVTPAYVGADKKNDTTITIGLSCYKSAADMYGV